jgi:hypothetical protein
MGSRILFSLINIPWRYAAALFLQMVLAGVLSYVLTGLPRSHLKRELRAQRRKDLPVVKPWGTGKKIGIFGFPSICLILPLVGPVQVLDAYSLLLFSSVLSSSIILGFYFFNAPHTRPIHLAADLRYFALVAAMFTFGAMNLFNSGADNSAATTEIVKITKLARAPRSSIVMTSGKFQEDLYVMLSHRDFKIARVGDFLELTLRKGKLGIPWIQTYRLLEPSASAEY